MEQAMLRRLVLFLWIIWLGQASADDSMIWKAIHNSGDAAKYPAAKILIIFDSTLVQVQESGLSYTIMHRLTKVLSPAGALDLVVQKFDYDPLSADVQIKSARIFRKNGTIELIPNERILDHIAPARAIYWGAREKMIPFGRLEVGDAVETWVVRKGFTYALLGAGQSDDESRFIPPMRGHFYDIVPFWTFSPVLIKTYGVRIPSTKPLQFRVYNGALTSWLEFQGDWMTYHWELQDIPAFQSEANMVAPDDVATKLLVSTSPDWIAKSLWFHKVNEDYGSFDVTPEILAKTRELVRDAKNDAEKIHILTHWVAEEIRYSGLSMGPGEGYTLHKADMTFRDRCGVCKDKAGLLVAMLRAVGLESYPAMTMAGSRIDRVPADQFNHCVTVWKKNDGDYVLLDPTWVPGVRELWSSAEQQQEYLMGVPEGADLKTTPISPPENHFFRVRGQSELLSDGSLNGTVTVTAEGQADSHIRRGFTRYMQSMWSLYLDQTLFDISPRAQILSVQHTSPTDISEPMKLVFQYQIPQYALVADGKMLFTPLVARHFMSDRGTSSHLYMDFNAEQRKYPFRTATSKLLDFKETIKLPKGYVLAHIPEFDSVAGTAVDFSARYLVNKTQLEFQQMLSMKKRIYEAEEWPEFRTALQNAKNVTETALVLVRK